MLSSSDENKEAQNGGDNQTWQEKLELLFGTDTLILEKNCCKKCTKFSFLNISIFLNIKKEKQILL